VQHELAQDISCIGIHYPYKINKLYSQPMDPVKFAVAGCGHIGKRHAALIVQNPHARLTAMIDTDPVTQADAQYNVPVYTSVESFLDSGTEADVVVIATPNAYHAGQALQVLHGGRHVVIEKPMTLKKQDAEKIIYTALQLHKNVFVVMQNRYSAPSLWLKELVEKDQLGNIFFVQINCFWNRDERYYTGGSWHRSKALDGGILFTQFSHFIDLLYWTFGDIQNITSRMASFNHRHLNEFEDTGMVTFDFVNGDMGCIHFSTSVWDKNLESSITVIGENGSIKIGGQYMDNIEYCHIKDYDNSIIHTINSTNKNAASNHVHTIQNVIDVIRSSSAITTNALEGLKVVDIIERIYSAGSRQ